MDGLKISQMTNIQNTLELSPTLFLYLCFVRKLLQLDLILDQELRDNSELNLNK